MEKQQREQQLYERIFDQFDANKDGKISPSELQHLVRSMGMEMTLEEAETAVAEWSGGSSSKGRGDGEIMMLQLGREEFARMVEGGEEEERLMNLKEAFQMYEMEGSGCITPKSLKRMLSKLGDHKRSIDECKAMISAFDLNGDGVLNFDEFKIMIMIS
ncbi:hypothetical protein Dimus_015841 [Dionaea muscipula]